jgi:hypothetical protein
MNLIRSVSYIWLLVIYSNTFAQNESSVCNCTQPDYSAPAGIFVDHAHARKEWMFSYRYMLMNMKGNQQGHSKLSEEEVYEHYIMAPSSMSMQMHMLMLMYGLSDKITLMGMSSIGVNSMRMSMIKNGNTSHVHSGSQQDNEYSSYTSGITDTKMYVLYDLWNHNGHELVLNLGLNIPTGKTSLRGPSMISESDKFSYIMQPGTGNFAFLPGITYTWLQRSVSGGMQLNAFLRTGKNKFHYRWGHEANISGWVSHSWNSWLSNSFRLDLTASDRIRGYDPEIAAMISIDPTADIHNYGGSRASVYGGLNIVIPSGSLEGLRITAEYGLPFYQNLNGIQMSLQSTLYTSIQYGF